MRAYKSNEITNVASRSCATKWIAYIDNEKYISKPAYVAGLFMNKGT